MNLKVRFWLLTLALISAMGLAACGGGGGGQTGGGQTGGDQPGGGQPGPSELNATTPGEQLKYDPATLTARSGGQVTVVFKNGSAAQKHNWVLVKNDADAQAIAQAAAATGGEAPDDSKVLGKTKMLNGGETGTATFTAPAAGTYVYFCSFPGHLAAGMKGTLTVQ